jgi:undecaprenyl-diphosphatase
MTLITFDKNLFLFINGFVGKLPAFDSLIKLVVNEYFVPVSLSLLLIYLWFRKGSDQRKNQTALPIALFSLIISNIIIAISNRLIIRERPFADFHVKLLFYKPADPSFPSNSATVAFAIATAIFLVNRKLGIFSIVLATFYAFSRVYAGVHFPSDVIAGALLGAAVSLLVFKFSNLIEITTNLFRGFQKKLKLDIE